MNTDMTIRILIWNCSMALHTKFDQLRSVDPDIAVIAECARPEIIKRKNRYFKPKDAAWIGHNDHKGLGVFSFLDLSLQASPFYDPAYELFLPLSLTGQHNFNLLAVWAFNHRTKNPMLNHGAPTRAALDYYRNYIISDTTFVAGDFNNSIIWDKPSKKSNFSFVKDDLQKLRLVSVYHENGCHEFGKEPDPTLFWRKNESEVYHIDYCFVPKNCLTNVSNITIGKSEDWLRFSDHAPLILEIELPQASSG